MAGSAAETLIGAVVLVAAGGFLAYAAQRTDLGAAPGYELEARFRRAEGINVGSDVRVAGVKVGSVTALSLDRATYEAVARLRVGRDLLLPDDSDARIATEGLLGGAYVAITPGASEFMLKPGDRITLTQGSVSLLDLLLKFGTEAARSQ